MATTQCRRYNATHVSCLAIAERKGRLYLSRDYARKTPIGAIIVDASNSFETVIQHEQ